MTPSNVTTPPPHGKSFLEKILSLFSVVKNGEGGSAILLTLNVFLLLGAYYFLKIVRDTLILDESGAAAASYSAAGQALLLLLVVPAYGYLAAKVNRIRLVSWATLFFVSHLVIFFGSSAKSVGRNGQMSGLWKVATLRESGKRRADFHSDLNRPEKTWGRFTLPHRPG